MLNRLLYSTHCCAQHITVLGTLLFSTHYNAQHIIVFNTMLCSTYYCTQHITVFNTLQYSTHYCIQLITVLNTLLYSTHCCTPHFTLTMELSVLRKIPISFSFRFHSSPPYRVAGLRPLIYTAFFIFRGSLFPCNNYSFISQ